LFWFVLDWARGAPDDKSHLAALKVIDHGTSCSAEDAIYQLLVGPAGAAFIRQMALVLWTDFCIYFCTQEEQECGMSVSMSVCLSVTRLHCAKTAERIEVLFGIETYGDPGHIVLDGGADPPRRRGGE